MMLEIALHPDELPIADWLNTRANAPPPGAGWAAGGTALTPPNTLSFDRSLGQVLLDLLDLYVDTAMNDHDLNPEAVNAVLRLREKILLAS